MKRERLENAYLDVTQAKNVGLIDILNMSGIFIYL